MRGFVVPLYPTSLQPLHLVLLNLSSFLLITLISSKLFSDLFIWNTTILSLRRQYRPSMTRIAVSIPFLQLNLERGLFLQIVLLNCVLNWPELSQVSPPILPLTKSLQPWICRLKGLLRTSRKSLVTPRDVIMKKSSSCPASVRNETRPQALFLSL